MPSHWQSEIDVDAGHETETSLGFPTRIAAAIAILTALTFVDATPRITLDSGLSEQPRTEQSAPSACGAEAVARAQREVDPRRPRPPRPTALS